VFPLTAKYFPLTGKCFSLTNFSNGKQTQESLERNFLKSEFRETNKDIVETLLLNGDAAMTVTRNRDDGFDWSHNCCF
jgi:hypothetical protein